MRTGGKGALWAALASCCAGAALAQTPAPASRATSPVATPQEVYNAAQQAFDGGDWDRAAAGFAQAVALINGEKPSLSKAIITTRLADAQLKLGHLPAARQSAETALNIFAGLLNAPPGEVAEAYIALGDAERFSLDDKLAAEAYRQALTRIEAVRDDADQALYARTGLILAEMVEDPDAAATATDQILHDQGAVNGMPKAVLAHYEALRGRAELNRGHPREALAILKRAVSESGGLTERLTLAQEEIRGDAAIAAQMSHDDVATHEYLTYTGAGHLPVHGWLQSGHLKLPSCGLDLAPEDTAVIQFAIDQDGRVLGAAPVYASRPGEMGLEFARAVRDWRWPASKVKALDPFWRSQVRVQLRCDVEKTDLSEPFAKATEEWLGSQGLDLNLDEPEELNTTVGKASDLAAVFLSPRFRRISDADWVTRSREADQILRSRQAPADVLSYFLQSRANKGGSSVRAQASNTARRLAEVIPLVDALPDSAHAAAWLRTEMAIGLEQGGDLSAAKPILEKVLATPTDALPEDDNIRYVAGLHLAVVEARDRKDKPAQQANLPPPDRCAALNVHPVAANASISDSTFPTEAMRWGFEGFVREAYDIDRQGRVEHVRTVIAYPPFVFDDATESAVAHFRYLPPLDSTGAYVGCVNQTLGVQYVMPR